MGMFNVKAHLDKTVLLSHLTAYIISLLLLVTLMPILVFIINMIKNTAAVMILVILSNFIAYEKGWQGYWPLLLPYVPFYNMVKPIDIVLTGVLAIVTFVVGLGLCKIQLSQRLFNIS
jgi:bacitracin transport system permease protein